MNHPLPIGTVVSLSCPNQRLCTHQWRVLSHRFLPDYDLASTSKDELTMLILATQTEVRPMRSNRIQFLRK
jgi:hypothetical protein